MICKLVMSSIKHVQKHCILNFAVASAQTNICMCQLFSLATLFEFQKIEFEKNDKWESNQFASYLQISN